MRNSDPICSAITLYSRSSLRNLWLEMIVLWEETASCTLYGNLNIIYHKNLQKFVVITTVWNLKAGAGGALLTQLRTVCHFNIPHGK